MCESYKFQKFIIQSIIKSDHNQISPYNITNLKGSNLKKGQLPVRTVLDTLTLKTLKLFHCL